MESRLCEFLLKDRLRLGRLLRGPSSLHGPADPFSSRVVYLQRKAAKLPVGGYLCQPEWKQAQSQDVESSLPPADVLRAQFELARRMQPARPVELDDIAVF